MRPIAEVAGSLGLSWDDLEPYGRLMAKVPLERFAGSPRWIKENPLWLA